MPASLAADAILFDLDGVLVDSRAAFATSLNHALVTHGLEARPPEDLHRYLGPPLHATLQALIGGDEPLIAACVETYRASLREHGARESALFDGIADAVGALARDVPLVVATSKPQALAQPLLAELGLADHFVAIIGPSLEARAEPKAVTIGRALEHLSAGARAVMVGDRRYDVLGAQAHGLPCVGVLWGIGDEAELRDAGAVALAERPEDLLTLLGAAPRT